MKKILLTVASLGLIVLNSAIAADLSLECSIRNDSTLEVLASKKEPLIAENDQISSAEIVMEIELPSSGRAIFEGYGALMNLTEYKLLRTDVIFRVPQLNLAEGDLETAEYNPEENNNSVLLEKVISVNKIPYRYKCEVK